MHNMNRIIKSQKLNHKAIKTILLNIRTLSTAAEPQDVAEHRGTQQSLWTRIVRKKDQKPPFMKNIFLGNFDKDLLTYPEFLNKEELSDLDEKVVTLQNSVTQINKYLKNSTRILTDSKEHLKNINIFGLQSGRIYNGLELNHTECCRLLEILSENNSLAASIVNHQLFGVNAIMNKSSEEIREKYLPKLSSGENIATACLLEEGNPDPDLMVTKAQMSQDGKHFILNGKKSWVLNGSQSDIYLVLASTEHKNHPNKDPTSLLIVESSFGGVSSSPCDVIGFEGADICHVNFENTHVPIENVIGLRSDGIKTVSSLLTNLRLNSGPLCLTLLKKLVKQFAEHCINTKQGEKYLMDTDFSKGILAEIDMNLYAIESMIYLTSGLLDEYENQDVELESAILKVFSSEKCFDGIQECSGFIGIPTFSKNHWIYELRNDALGNILFHETNDSLRIIIALLGLQHAGLELNTEVKKQRNPLFNPGYIFKKIWKHRRQNVDDPKLEMRLEDNLHPSLTHGARWLEYCVYRLQFATESILVQFGPEVIEQHMSLKRLADVAIDIYAMIAVLARSSRSYCIGLRNADYEILTANAFCLNARERVKNNVLEIVRGPYSTNDVNYQKIAKHAFKFDGYFAEHPLKQNF